MVATAVDALHLPAESYPESAYHQPADFSSDDSHLEAFLEKVRLQVRASDWKLKAGSGRSAASLTDLAAEPYVEASDQYARRQGDIAEKRVKALHAAKARIQKLKSDARIEGHSVSSASEDDLVAFLNDHAFTRRPFITLLDNGNLRALWRSDAGEQIGIQFRGGKEVQYVFFARREGQAVMAQAFGRDRLSDIDRQIDALNLGRLMTA